MLGICASSPLLLGSALAVKLSSPGPVIFRTTRVGRGGEPFVMLKFRTMHSSDGRDQPRVTAADDARVFPAGRVLRRLKFDELPQLFNVVYGNMALVGPRPEDPSIVEQFYSDFMLESLNVRPGLTSPGSLHYFRDENDMPSEPSLAERVYVNELLQQKIALDLAYVRHRAWRYDAEIVVRTIASVVGVHVIFGHRQAWEREEADVILSGRSADARPRVEARL